MVSFRVILAPEAQSQLIGIQEYISLAAAPDIATDVVEGIVDYCQSLTLFPMRGTARDDLRPGLRIVGYDRRASIAFSVHAGIVMIHGIFYGGQDYESAFRDDRPRPQPPA